MKNLPKIIFFQVKKPSDKLLWVTKTATLHFENKKPLLIIVSDDKALKFVDELLWKEPQFSFLPHSSLEVLSNDLIVITQKKLNLNKAQYVFNLSSEPFTDFSCSVVYELDDQIDNIKILQAKKKFKFYKELGYLIESR